MSILSTLRLRGRRIIGPLNGGVAVIAMACRSGCGCGLACRWWPGSWVFRVVGRRGAGGRTQPTVTALTGLADHPADDARFELAEPRQCGVRRLSEPLQSAGLCQSSQGHARRFKKRYQHNEPGRDIALAISQNVVCVDLIQTRAAKQIKENPATAGPRLVGNLSFTPFPDNPSTRQFTHNKRCKSIPTTNETLTQKIAQQIIHEQNHCPCGPEALPG